MIYQRHRWTDGLTERQTDRRHATARLCFA